MTPVVSWLPRRILVAAAVLAGGVCGPASAGAPEDADSEMELLIAAGDFDGEHFEGFTKRGGKATYHFEGEVLVGTSVAKTPNTFLCTDKHYGDFLLEYEIRIDEGLNSGVQVRSHCSDQPTVFHARRGRTSRVIEIAAGRVHGYQVEIDTSPRAWSAGIYDEGRRGWLYKLEGDKHAAAREAFDVSGWNQYRVEAIGDRIRTWINGVPAADLTDDATAEGFIAFQVHSVGKAKDVGKQVRWRNVRIKTLDAE